MRYEKIELNKNAYMTTYIADKIEKFTRKAMRTAPLCCYEENIKTQQNRPLVLRYSKTADGNTTTFVYDNANIVAEITAEGTNKYYRGIEIIKNDDNLYYIYNGQGDVAMLITGEGETVADYEFDAYGNSDSESAVYNPFGYRGEYQDAESGLIYLRARMYDPETGRFINEDPIKDGLNWYIYCSGNPIMFIDPSGFEYIVVSGSEEDSRYKYNFIEPAIKKIIELKELDDKERITWIVSKTAYTEEALKAMNNISYELGVGFVTIESATQFSNYVNSQDVFKSKLSESRKNDPIRKMVFFSHGVEGAVELGYGQSNRESLSINKEIVESIFSRAFDSPNTWFYSCNGATGGKNSIAEHWYNKTGGFTGAYLGKTTYEFIMYPQDYSSIKKIWSKKMRKIDDSIDKRRSKLGFSKTGSDYYPIPSNGTKQVTWGG